MSMQDLGVHQYTTGSNSHSGSDSDALASLVEGRCQTGSKTANLSIIGVPAGDSQEMPLYTSS